MSAGLVLSRTADIWRKILQPDNTYKDSPVLRSVKCQIVPITSLASDVPFAYESTHVIWIPFYFTLRKEDQVREGRQPPDAQGDLRQHVFTINGRRFYQLGMPQHAYYAKELD